MRRKFQSTNLPTYTIRAGLPTSGREIVGVKPCFSHVRDTNGRAPPPGTVNLQGLFLEENTTSLAEGVQTGYSARNAADVRRFGSPAANGPFARARR